MWAATRLGPLAIWCRPTLSRLLSHPVPHSSEAPSGCNTSRRMARPAIQRLPSPSSDPPPPMGGARTRVFLIGPMGAGKTAIGRELARQLKLEFLDADQEIERRTGA